MAHATDLIERTGVSMKWLSMMASRAVTAFWQMRTLPTDYPNQFTTYLVVIISGVLIFCIGWGACTVERRLIASAGHSLVQAASDSASKLELMISERTADVEMLASSAIARGDNRQALTLYLYRLLEVYHAYQWVGVTDANGILIAATDRAQVSQDRSKSLWFKQAAARNQVTIVDAGTSKDAKGRLSITITAPVRTYDGRFLGAVAAVVEIPYLLDQLDRTTRVLQGVAWLEDSHIEYQLLDGKGDLVADSALRQEGRLNLRTMGLLSAQLVAISERGFVEEQHLRRNKPVITAYAQVNLPHAHPASRWGILIRIDRDSILTPIRTFLKKLMVVTMLIVAPIGFLLIWLVKQLHRKWHQVKQESERASKAEAALGAKAEALHAMVRAAKRMASTPQIDEMLHQVLDIARKTTRARFAVLGILDREKGTFARTFTIGLDETRVRAIEALPVEGGILNCLTQREGVLRIDDLSTEILLGNDLPPYLPLTSFLGISIRCHGQMFGQLYLAEKVSSEGTTIAFTDLDEQILLMLSAQTAISIENLQLLQDSKEQALRDSLTGLLNHSASVDALNRELSRADREHEGLAVIMADIDHFKRINDTYGHRVGDVVLHEVAKRVQEAARRYDLVGRVGGEEFLVLLPGCDEASASEFAERIRFAICGTPIDTQVGPLTVTVSIGATTWSNDKPAIPHLLWETADQALYRVKENGRNGIAFVPLQAGEDCQTAA
ncbi:MAG TPA: diguanylate cyclase [Nitrospira sp.]|nr:diguanylate cyclase [Nitrospira sp.]